jgi:protein O-GlcNAc transferase
MNTSEWLRRAKRFHQTNQLKKATELYHRVLAVEPECADALHLLGLIEIQNGAFEKAVEMIRRAVRSAPEQPAFHHHLGVAHLRRRDFVAAEAGFRQALALGSDSPESLGLLGEVLVALGRAPEATGYYERATAQMPHDPKWHRGLADALHACGRLAEAVGAYRRTLALTPDDGTALWGLGCALTTLCEYGEAADCLSRLVAVDADWAEAQHNLGRVLHELGQTDAAVAAFRLAAGRLASPEMTLIAIATIVPGAPSANNQSILEARRSMGAFVTEKPIDLSALAPEKARGRLRVGYVSSFFRDRNWMKQVWALINNHDRGRIEVHLFSDDPESTIGGEYRRHPEDRFHFISTASNLKVAQAIADQGIDVLVDLNGYSKPSRLPLFFHRPAPVIVAWYNMYATTGLNCFDYLIGDDIVIPAEDEPYCTERILRLPGCYLPLEVGYSVPDVTPPPCLERGFITFGSLAPQYKITPPTIAAWADILKQCPGSRLVLKSRFLGSPSNRQYMHQQFERHGVAAELILMDGPAEHFEFLAKYSEIDLAFDTFPYNGGTTTMESLWQGVPVLCFHGNRWASRISASIMRNAGLPEFVAANVDGFRDMAANLATRLDTPAYLAQLRRTMRDRLLGSAVCDVHGFARNMEDLYRRICRP